MNLSCAFKKCPGLLHFTLLTIWDKVSAYFKKESNSDPGYNKFFLKTKVKSHSDEGTDFDDKVNSNQTCLAVIKLDYALKKDLKIV